MSVPPDPVVHFCREDQIKIPHYDEILLLTKLEEQVRKVGINTYQTVRALHTTQIKNNLSKKKHCGIYSKLAGNFTRFGIKSTNWWRRIIATERGHKKDGE